MLITDALAAEHGVLYALFDHLESVLATATLAELGAQTHMLRAAVGSHAQLEDELLFADLERYLGADAGPLEMMRTEHRMIEDGLDQLPGLADVAAARRLLRDVITTARDHFAKEERIVFPMALATLEARTLATRGTRWIERRHVATTVVESPLVGTVD
jgi:iron-sulfur cluster repair protein YtfE (RIC family)